VPKCRNYVGVACVDGSCPMANRDEYAERGYDITHNCDECVYHKGCEDCAMDGTYCNNKSMYERSKHVKDSTELSGGHLW
jgi:hypothetical protein